MFLILSASAVQLLELFTCSFPSEVQGICSFYDFFLSRSSFKKGPIRFKTMTNLTILNPAFRLSPSLVYVLLKKLSY